MPQSFLASFESNPLHQLLQFISNPTTFLLFATMSQLANLALEGGDPRNPEHPITRLTAEPLETQLLRAAHDSSVTFEEYVYWADITRAEEKHENQKHRIAAGPKTLKSLLKNRFSNYKAPIAVESPRSGSTAEEKPTVSNDLGADNALTENNAAVKKDENPTVLQGNLGGVSDAEYKNASRAIRTASWSSIFYLITTDILGPFSTP